MALPIVVGVGAEGVSTLLLFMPRTQLVFFSKLFKVLLAKKSVIVTFRLLQLRLRSRRPFICFVEDVVAGEAVLHWRLLRDLALRTSSCNITVLWPP